MNDVLLTHYENRVLTITMNRPERRNALNMKLYSRMAETIDSAQRNDEIRVILITGSSRCFTSGNDLEDFVENPPTENGNSPVAHFMKALVECPKPVVAAVQGSAVGIGVTMLLHCDLVYVGDSSKFQLPFVNLGLCPEFSSSLILPQLVGHSKACELLMLGEPFDGATAVKFGIANQVVSDDKLMELVEAKCSRLVRQPPSAIRATKKLLRDNQRDIVERVMNKEMMQFGQGLESAEFNEAVTAFFEKRSCDFSNFS